MTDTQTISGSCMCGAVTVRAQVAKPAMRACHYEMCRKQTSSMFMSLNTVPESVEIEGDVTTFVSSDWAQRGFCGTCGSTIFYRTREDGVRQLAAGLFENAADAPMKLEFFTDNCPEAYALTGSHRKLNTQETLAIFAPEAGDH